MSSFDEGFVRGHATVDAVAVVGIYKNRKYKCSKRSHGLLSITNRSNGSQKSDEIKGNFFPSRVVSSLLYGCTTWMLTKCIEKKLDGNCTRIL